ncbi:hypothetical protein DSC47_10360 [Elizabethkingia miricola]|uniref:hypothetical protein n=1 Tax=Elizabethkingia bruuniana TaxID=1756149 RepID=UPI0009990744|nr:hypothetical protein [Elizabethkingia bruuniana]OPC62612.1 hypothetical protein BAY13_07315 [Elizabethkingia bruuniana]RBI91689.1 hypothetical protein DSC47_10360 [Elizabethkingia miricola]
MRSTLNHHRKRAGVNQQKRSVIQDNTSQFAALFYIRNANTILRKDLTDILGALKELENLNKQAKDILSLHCSTEVNQQCENTLSIIGNNLAYVEEQIFYIKENIVEKNRLNSYIFWQQNQYYIEKITIDYKHIETLGFQILPKEEKLYWRINICDIQNEFFTLIIALINVCMGELKYIEAQTPARISNTTSNIMHNIPGNYTLQQAKKYEKEYLKALLIYKTEFNKKRNLWDRLLDILAGGAHQSPKEHVMLDRWINGNDER